MKHHHACVNGHTMMVYRMQEGACEIIYMGCSAPADECECSIQHSLPMPDELPDGTEKGMLRWIHVR